MEHLNLQQIYYNSYYRSTAQKSKVLICTARAGNVIGGGDWSPNRIFTDCIQSWSKKGKLKLETQLNKTVATCVRCYFWIHEVSISLKKPGLSGEALILVQTKVI